MLCAMEELGAPIAYLALEEGTPVYASGGVHVGAVQHVLAAEDADIFDGIVIATDAGLRFIDADSVREITRSHIQSSLDDDQASRLPPPDGPPVYRVDALEDTGHSFHDVLGRLFRRPHWTREHD